jgi:cytochrome P450
VLGPALVPAGTVIAVSPYLIHRRTDLYEEPGVFRPQRWYDRRPERGRFLPFGAGARTCIAERAALADLTLVLAEIVTRWLLEPCPDSPVKPAVTTTLGPRGLRLRTVARGGGT